MLRTTLLAAASVGTSAYRRSHRDSAADVATEGGFEEFEIEEDVVEPVSLGNCEVVSRRRAFSTTCACRRRSTSESTDFGLNCIDSTMQCEAGFEWNGERCASTSAGGDAGGDAGAASPVAPAPVAPAPPPPGNHRPIPPPVGSGTSATNPVTEIYMYRAQEYDGDSPYAMENVNLADLPGVLQYIHREVITEHTIGSVDRRTGEARSARKYDISSLLRYRFLIKNPNRLSAVNMDFDGYATFDFGQASNQEQWNDFMTVGDAVGAQTQSNTHVPFPDPYYWFSLSGFCPNLPYTGSAITTLCPENLQTLSGTCLSKSEAATNGCWQEGELTYDKCLCYNGGSLVWGGLCGADLNRNPPSHIQVPTGDRGCTYSYEPHADVISLDDLTGITSEMCNGQPCKDWADFRTNCDNSEYKKTFTPLGNLQRTAYCVEYDLHPDCAQLGCQSRQCQRIPEADREYGLPFWKGRCSERANQRRAELAAEAFGVADASTTHKVTVPSSPGYEHTPCNRTASLECSPNMIYGEGYCTRAWSGICTACRIAGTLHPTANTAIHHCPWTITDGEYSHTLQRGRWCSQPLLPSKVCCLYSDSCATKIADVPGQVDTLPLTDDSFALVLATSNTETVKTFFIRLAKELMGLTDADIAAKDAELSTEAYWAWDDKPKKEFMMNDVIRVIKATDLLHTLFPASEVYTTLPPTTSTTTTTPRRWTVLTTHAPRAATDAPPLTPECQCSETGVVRGVDTHRPGCKAHLGRHFGPFCYIEGGTECPGNIRYSRSLRVHYRKRCS